MNKTLFLLLSLALLWGCLDDPFENHSLQLEAEAGVTEAWLSLHVQGLKSGAVYTLQRNGKNIFNSRLQKADTVVYDSLLTPATGYRYRFFASEQGETSPAAETVLTTMDTTSHDFDWQIYTFGGQKGSSVFYDVAIIDENDIWAVGEIYTADTYTYDSLGNWIDPYNAAHWDGEKWTLKRILFEFEGQQLFGKINSVFAFNKDDVWFGMGSVIHWNGERYQSIKIPDTIFPSLANKIWGTSSSDLYIVGNDGLMAHYDGTGWTKIETGTELDIRDIWGAYNNKSGDYEILAVASNMFQNNGYALIKISDKTSQIVQAQNLPWSLNTIWFSAGKVYYIAGDGLYRSNRFPKHWQKNYSLPNLYKNRVRGQDINDLFLVGDFSLISHFNGKSWQNYAKNELHLNAGDFYGLDIKNNLVVSVGINNPESLIIMGTRNK